jgi:hypothetical protein
LRRKDEGALIVAVRDTSDLPSLLSLVRDAGAPFAADQAGSPPAVVFEDLRKKGLVSGEYVEITLIGQGLAQFFVR